LAWQTTFLTRISNIVSQFFFQFSSAIFLKQLPQVRWKTNKCNFRIDLVGCPFRIWLFYRFLATFAHLNEFRVIFQN
jgi:hypothetical protein